MFHAQPTSTLLPHTDRSTRIQPHAGPGVLLGLLVSLRELRKTTAASAPVIADSAAPPARVPAHPGGQSSRLRSGLGGRMEQARRRRAARSARRRGDRHLPGRRADRRGL